MLIECIESLFKMRVKSFSIDLAYNSMDANIENHLPFTIEFKI
jgi:hypothetical protein